MVVTMSKKHVSRKLKSSWRKHIDISDVDQFLEEQRQDERTGGQIADKSDKELFHEETRPAKVKDTLREIRRKKFVELPRSLQPLVNTSNVPDPIVKRNVKKDRHLLAPVPAATMRFRKRPRKGGIVKPAKEDLWAKETPVPGELQNEWIAKEQVHHTLAHTGKPLVINQPAKMDKAQRSVPLRKRLPHKGLSYNPAIDDYLELKDKVVKQEKSIVRLEEHLDRVLTKKLVTMTPEEKHRTRMLEMSEGLLKAEPNQSDSEEEKEKNGDGEEEDTPAVVVKSKKRITKAKKRARELQQQEEKLLQRELNKLVEIDRVEEIANEVEQAERKTKRKAAWRVKKKLAKRAKLDLPLDFVEPQKLSGSLRTIEPLNNLLATGLPKVRTVSILKRTRAEVERKLRKPGKKRYTRSSHKEPLPQPTKPTKRAK
uniref:Ribosome biogenesis protein NOP53 n=1 Tax=Anopheles christyi TaxID=43041 RepID=A0A182KB48_9DIPT